MKKIILTLSLLLFACNQDTKEKLVVYQSPSCGCCSGWVANMEENGFNVEAIKTEDMYSTKVNAGIDMSLSSCHTGFIGDYFVEGHVPHDAIEKLLNERPDIKGITVPGMPSGINVPGMEVSNERAKFDVLAVNNDGTTFVWKSYE
tara:strand:+ start:520 stop:957 length:438 start_codon:yes stop_codon:yes gene_type:complete